MIRVRLQTFRSLRVTGIERGQGITKATINTLAREIVQDTIADQFAKERTAKGPLRFNTPGWQRRKAKKGWDKRRGHMLGRLQKALDNAVLWRVNYTKPTKDKAGSATIIFSEQKLKALVDHYKFYQKQKTPAKAGVLIVNKTRAKEFENALRKNVDTTQSDRIIERERKKQLKRARERLGRKRRRA